MRVLRSIARFWTVCLGIVALLLALGLAVRLLLPRVPWLERPALLTISPADGTTNVALRSTFTFTFNQAMNPASVERALLTEPPTSGTLAWRNDNHTFIFTPQLSLTSNTTYTVTLEASALSRWWQPLSAPLRATFRTVQAPSVVSALPNTAGVPTDTALALAFSQPMVAPDVIGKPVVVPQLRIDPPLENETRWLDPYTLLIRPLRPMNAATAYRATMAAGLPDAYGSELDQPFSWNWRTRGPSVTNLRPADGAQWVGAQQPLLMALSQPLELDDLRAGLQISPTVTGEFSAAVLITGTQVVTFTPTGGWQPGTTYTARLHTEGVDLLAAAAPVPTWRFTVEPALALVGRFPGEGQLLPRGQALRLIFSTPMEEASLRNGLSLDPPAGPLEIAVSETEVRVLADLRPSTTYTLTIAPTVANRNGVPLCPAAAPPCPYRLRFLSAPAAPALALSEHAGNLAQVPVDRVATVPVERTNISAVNMALYKLDEATLLRTLNFSTAAWRDFSPERYNQPLLRSWRLTFDDPANQPVQATLPITQSDKRPLDPGIYYLRMLAVEGPRVDVVVLASPITLALKQSDRAVLVWAVNRADGSPAADLPLTLYQGDAVVAQGRSNADGVWQVAHQRSPDRAAYFVLANGPLPALVLQGAAEAADPPAARYRGALFTDRAQYAPGDLVTINGFARQVAANGAPELPAANTRLDVLLQKADDSPVLSNTSVQLPAGGVVSATLQLNAALAPGAYIVRANLGGATFRLPIQVVTPDPLFKVDLAALQDPARAGVRVQVSSAGVPAAGAQIDWRLRAQAVPAAQREGFSFYDDALPPLLLERSGSGTSDADGTLTLPLFERSTITQTLRLSFTARVREPGGVEVETARVITIKPNGPQLGLRLPERIVLSNERPVVELLALDANGAPATSATISVTVLRQNWDARGQPLPPDTALRRSATTDVQGRASVPLTTFKPGVYRIVARAEQNRSATALWVAGPGFTARQGSAQRMMLVSDRDRYQPGDTARVLLMQPYAESNALVTLEQSGVITPELRMLRAGQLLDLPITPAMASGTTVGVMLTQRGGGDRASLSIGSARLPIDAALPRLTTLITNERDVYAPGATATLTITTRDAQGNGAGGNAIIILARDEGFAQEPIDLARLFNPPRPSGFTTAQSYAGNTTPDPTQGAAARDDATFDQATTLQLQTASSADGTFVVRLPLPPEPGRWRAFVYTDAGAALFGQADTSISTAASFSVQPLAPPILRVGDRAVVALPLRSTNDLTQQVTSTLNIRGGRLNEGDALQTQSLPPNSAQRFTWNISPDDPLATGAGPTSTATLRLDTSTPGLLDNRTRLRLPVFSAAVPLATTTQELTAPLSSTLSLPTPSSIDSPLLLELAIAPNVRAAVAASASALAALPERSVEQEASLLILSARLAQDSDARTALPWRIQAQRALAALTSARAGDGGWGWWPGGPSHPFITAYVLEAQATARAALQTELDDPTRALALLAQADRPSVDTNLRAYLHYVRGLLGSGDPAAARALLDAGLAADGLAYLALTLPPDEAGEVLARLSSLPQRDAAPDETVFWEASGSTGRPHSRISTTALVAAALQRARPGNAQIEPALRTLRLAWNGEGWPTALDSARAAQVLLNAMPPDNSAPVTATLRLNGRDVLATQTLTTTERRWVSIDPSSTTTSLAISVAPRAAGQAPLLAIRSYARLRDAAQGQPRAPATLALHQDYIDPVSGVVLDPAVLRLGQVLRVRATLVVQQPVNRLDLRLALPSAFALVRAEAAAPFLHAGLDPAAAALVFSAADLAPGVYTQSYLARVVAAGDYAAPAPRALPVFTPDNAVSGIDGRIVATLP